MGARLGLMGPYNISLSLSFWYSAWEVGASQVAPELTVVETIEFDY